jgi:hypothetical protein
MFRVEYREILQAYLVAVVGTFVGCLPCVSASALIIQPANGVCPGSA